MSSYKLSTDGIKIAKFLWVVGLSFAIPREWETQMKKISLTLIMLFGLCITTGGSFGQI
jgi:hypothetical protein